MIFDKHLIIFTGFTAGVKPEPCLAFLPLLIKSARQDPCVMRHLVSN